MDRNIFLQLSKRLLRCSVSFTIQPTILLQSRNGCSLSSSIPLLPSGIPNTAQLFFLPGCINNDLLAVV